MADVTIVDTSPRDGAIAFPKIRTSEKVALANSLIKSGTIKIDCATFMHPRLKPEYADAEKVVGGIQKRPGVTVIGLAPNEIACRRALSTDVGEIGILVAATESFNQAILGTSIKETLYKTFPAILQACQGKGKTIRVYLLAAFCCQYEGRVSIYNIVELASKLAFLGINEISLVDSPGMANPKQVKETIRALQGQNLEAKLAVHFHNTRGLGLANCFAAYEEGIRIFDTAIGGLSGPPFGVPKMEAGSWNVPTEDLVHLFDEIGVNTGINLDKLLSSAILAQKIAGQELFGHVLKVGTAFQVSHFPEMSEIHTK